MGDRRVGPDFDCTDVVKSAVTIPAFTFEGGLESGFLGSPRHRVPKTSSGEVIDEFGCRRNTDEIIVKVDRRCIHPMEVDFLIAVASITNEYLARSTHSQCVPMFNEAAEPDFHELAREAEHHRPHEERGS
jgi:hypothetical protein